MNIKDSDVSQQQYYCQYCQNCDTHETVEKVNSLRKLFLPRKIQTSYKIWQCHTNVIVILHLLKVYCCIVMKWVTVCSRSGWDWCSRIWLVKCLMVSPIYLSIPILDADLLPGWSGSGQCWVSAWCGTRLVTTIWTVLWCRWTTLWGRAIEALLEYTDTDIKLRVVFIFSVILNYE